jgi:hypothetical protein
MELSWDITKRKFERELSRTKTLVDAATLSGRRWTIKLRDVAAIKHRSEYDCPPTKKMTLPWWSSVASLLMAANVAGLHQEDETIMSKSTATDAFLRFAR